MNTNLLMRKFYLQGRKALVTGASSGLGRHFAAVLAAEITASGGAQRRWPWKDLDGALLLLASQAGAYITGAEIVADGGHSCSSL